MTEDVNIAFEKRRITAAINDLYPVKIISDSMKKTKKYQQIAISVQEVGIVEPLVIHRQKNPKDKYLLLDGHLRLEALKDLGATEAPCLVAKDDEAFTYNKRINRLASIQEHYMILNAIKNGVSEARVAQALGVDIARIRQKRKLLDGICPEVIEILKDRHFPGGSINAMKRMKPLRQVETVELMVATNNFSLSYARALLMATPKDQLKEPEGKKPTGGIGDEERRRMETELENVRRDMKTVEADYGTNVVRLVVANGYVIRLLNNHHVAHYMGRNQSDLLEQLQSITDSISDDTGTTFREDTHR